VYSPSKLVKCRVLLTKVAGCSMLTCQTNLLLTIAVKPTVSVVVEAGESASSLQLLSNSRDLPLSDVLHQGHLRQPIDLQTLLQKDRSCQGPEMFTSTLDVVCAPSCIASPAGSLKA
jgi:hypothetical protein